MGVIGVLAAVMVLCGSTSLADSEYLKSQMCDSTSTEDTIYQFSEKLLNKNATVRLSRFREKGAEVILIVNVATYWGYTHQYLELDALQLEFPKRLAILGFPCNQFGQQEPGGNDLEIYNGIRYVRPGGDFQPKLTLFRKIDVNGGSEHPLYTYLKTYCPPTRSYFMLTNKLYYTPLRVGDIRWNFEKFLVNREGKPVKRYDASATVSDMRSDILALLSTEV